MQFKSSFSTTKTFNIHGTSHCGPYQKAKLVQLEIALHLSKALQQHLCLEGGTLVNSILSLCRRKTTPSADAVPLQILCRWQFSYYVVFQLLLPVCLKYSLKGLKSTVHETQETRQCSHCIFEKCDECLLLLSARKSSTQGVLVSKK